MNCPSAAGFLFLWRNGKFLESLYFMWREETVGFFAPFLSVSGHEKGHVANGAARRPMGGSVRWNLKCVLSECGYLSIY